MKKVNITDVFKASYNDPTKIGSSHWFRTIISNAKHCAEYLQTHYHHDGVDAEVNQLRYATEIKDVVNDLIKAQEMGLIITSDQHHLEEGKEKSLSLNLKKFCDDNHFTNEAVMLAMPFILDYINSNYTLTKKCQQ